MEQNPVDSEQQAVQQSATEKRASNDSRTRKFWGIEPPPVPPTKSARAQQRWNEFRPSKTLFLWSLMAAVALTLLVGFTWGGWMTSAGAQTMANNAARSAVVERLAPICVAQFNLDPEKEQKLLVLQGSSSFERTRYVTDQAWATLPGETKPTSQVAAACANLLMQIGQ